MISRCGSEVGPQTEIIFGKVCLLCNSCSRNLLTKEGNFVSRVVYYSEHDLRVCEVDIASIEAGVGKHVHQVSLLLKSDCAPKSLDPEHKSLGRVCAEFRT